MVRAIVYPTLRKRREGWGTRVDGYVRAEARIFQRILLRRLNAGPCTSLRFGRGDTVVVESVNPRSQMRDRGHPAPTDIQRASDTTPLKPTEGLNGPPSAGR